MSSSVAGPAGRHFLSTGKAGLLVASVVTLLLGSMLVPVRPVAAEVASPAPVQPSGERQLTTTTTLVSPSAIVGWGRNDDGQATPPTGSDFIAIAAGGYHGLALRSDGTIAGWGRDEPYGQATPPTGSDFVAIAAGYEHSLALRSDGTIAGWGRDEPYGQATPPAGSDFVAITATYEHSLALRSDGTVVGWGRDDFGQATPPTGSDFVAVAAGGYHGLALQSDGTIAGWGRDDDGQATPPAGSDFVAIAAGQVHSLALRSDGSIAGWGRDDDGQATPPTGNDFVAIAAGGLYSLALRSDGSIAGWGYNDAGQATPPADSDFVAIAAGYEHGLALESTAPPKADTTTAVTSDTNPSVYGQGVTFTATVTTATTPGSTVATTNPANGTSPVTSGTVDFKDGGTTITGCAAAALNGSGQATCGPLTDLAVGDHAITAVYSGDTNFNTSTSAALTQTVTSSSTVDTTLPVTSNVTVVLRAGGQVSSGPLLLSWSASDNVTPAADLFHQVQVRRLKHGVWGPWNNVATVSGSQLEVVRPLWRHYQYRVQTRDEAGNWGAWAETAPIVLLRRDEGQFRKGSGWTTRPMARAMRGDVARSSTVGSWARLRFWGNGVALVMPAGVGLGSIEVCLDAGTSAGQCQNVDLSTFTPSGQRRLVAVFNGLTNGLHHLRVTVTGGTVNLDGALISK